MKKSKILLILAALVLAVAFTATTALAADPLPSWNDGPAKNSILEFVEKVTTAGSPDFVPIPERIAVFDNDGTLWCEQPLPVQLYFALDRVKTLVASGSVVRLPREMVLAADEQQGGTFRRKVNP